MEELEERTKLIISKSICPITGFSSNNDMSSALLIIELDSLFEIEVEHVWEINPEMKSHLEETDTVILAEVLNYSSNLKPGEAIRTHRALSLEIRLFIEFFYDTKLPEKKYMYVSQQVFTAITNKYFNNNQ